VSEISRLRYRVRVQGIPSHGIFSEFASLIGDAEYSNKIPCGIKFRTLCTHTGLDTVGFQGPLMERGVPFVERGAPFIVSHRPGLRRGGCGGGPRQQTLPRYAYRCRANSAHTRPDFGLGFQVKSP